MGLPNVNIVFKSKAAAAIQQGAAGILALVFKDTSAAVLTTYILQGVNDTPAGMDEANTDLVEKAFMGTPKEIKLVLIDDAAADYTEAMNYLETIEFNVVAFPGAAGADVATLSTWAKGMFDTKLRKITAVLPNNPGDHPAVINFATDDIIVGDTTYSATQYVARIAGIIAGLPLTVSPTFQVLSEVADVPKLTKAQADAAIDAGKLILYHDGKKVKIARGVTSFVTTTEAMGADWKKVKIVRVLNKIYHDVKDTIEDNYIGKVQNSYVNKLLLTSAINAYFEQLELDGPLDPGKNRADIDAVAQKTYLQSIGEDVTKLTDQQIREANTRDQVFLAAAVRPLDAIEDVKLDINL